MSPSSYSAFHGKDLGPKTAYLLNHGASTSIRDYNGRTCLHEAVKNHPIAQLDQVPFDTFLRRDDPAGHGLDIQAIDHCGNSLLHELALRQDTAKPEDWPNLIDFWEKLISMGLDLEQKNHSGRTPLHILCTRYMGPDSCKGTSPLDFIISRTKNIDNPDHDGVTPLHITAAEDQRFVKKLLDAGADPTVATYEGLTPLHVASHCGESNTVGILLDALEQWHQKKDPTTLNLPRQGASASIPVDKIVSSGRSVTGVNAQTYKYGDEYHEKFTPLYCACQSGRPETVALLLEAGADVNDGNMFEACARFEKTYGGWGRKSFKNLRASGYSIPFQTDDFFYQKVGRVDKLSEDETARLEEIVDMLVKHGANVSNIDAHHNGGPLRQAMDRNRDYAAACLRRAKEAGEAKPPDHEQADALVSRLMNESLMEAQIKILKDFGGVTPGNSNFEMFRHLLVRREYRLVDELVHLGADFLHKEPGKRRPCNLQFLVASGFTSLVEKIGPVAADAALKGGEWHAFGDPTRPGLWRAKRVFKATYDHCEMPAPFIYSAVERKLPNMGMVRLLVEKLGVDINEPLYTSVQGIRGGPEAAPTSSALHHVSKGKTWWQVHQALPYLLNAGADINLRNDKGRTPLHVALQMHHSNPGYLHKDAARILIEAGADVNAVDKYEQGCLASVRNDVVMTKLLLTHGAIVTGDAILAAVDAGNAEVLLELLSGGFDPNACHETASKYLVAQCGIKIQERWWTAGRRDTQGPSGLYNAAAAVDLSHKEHGKPRESPRFRRMLQSRAQLVQVLLDHGADPFQKLLSKVQGSRQSIKADVPSIQVPEGYEELTLLHTLLVDGKVVDNFLDLPGLDVHHRDAQGRTLLLAACRGFKDPNHVLGSYKESPDSDEGTTVLQRLLSLGADPADRDHSGRNALHLLLRNSGDLSKRKRLLEYIIKKAPNLLHQADQSGRTPLHYAVTYTATQEKVETAKILLSAGADRLAVDNDGDGILHMLIKGLLCEELQTFFQQLLAGGMDINVRNNLGQTPACSFYNSSRTRERLRMSFREDNEAADDKICQLLKDAGADFFVRDAEGRGLLHLAAIGDVVRFKELLSLGLDPMMEDNEQRTALDVAAACDNQEILGLFEKK